MGGTGVASARYTSAGFMNPALLTMFNSGDHFGFILPSVGVGAADEDGLIDAIENFQDEVDRVQANPAALTPQDLTRLADNLSSLGGKRATIGLGGAASFAIPSKTFAWGLFAHSWVEGQVGINIDPNDDNSIRTATPANVVSRLDNLDSEGRILGTNITEVGIAMATEVAVGGMGILSVGVMPKLQRIETYNYSINVNTFEDSDFTDSQFREDTTEVNLDLGVALRPIPPITIGLVARNVIEHETDTVVTAGQRFTHILERELTLGAAWSGMGLTVAADVDLIDVDRFKNIVDESQFVRAGVEYTLFGWMQARLGVQHDFEDTVDDLFTGGLGLSPFDTVHVDITGTWDGDKGYGAMAQFWFTF